MTEPEQKRTWPILAVLILVGLTAGIGLGLTLGWVVWPVSYTNTTLANLSTANKEDYIVLTAAAYTADRDLEKAEGRLAWLEAPNAPQWVAELADRFIAEGRNETDIRSLVELAHALGVDTEQMAPYLGATAPKPQPESIP
ncbi:MAG: hypothetical protein JXM73_01790 [Anaerolineae bacterium]|nr:hypothetical protein [Anaerolineae bacterium]